MGIFWLGFPFRIFHRTETKSEFIAVMVPGIVFVFISGFMGGASSFGLALCIREILRFQDLDDPYRERLTFEF